MTTVTLEEAKTHLDELIARLHPGEEILITDQGQPLAQVRKAERTSWPCKAGGYRKAGFWSTSTAAGPCTGSTRERVSRSPPGDRRKREPRRFSAVVLFGNSLQPS